MSSGGSALSAPDPTLSPYLYAVLSEEIRAFLHIAGIELRQNVHCSATPMMTRDGINWILWLPTSGDPRTLDYWREVARIAYDQIVPRN